MHIQKLLEKTASKISFEFFPPKSSAARASLFQTIRELQSCDPSFVSVTYGAGGTTRDATCDLVGYLMREKKFETIPHLTCLGHRERDISNLLESYAEAGVSNILALRGDPPKNSAPSAVGDFTYAADLVAFIRRFSEKHRHDFGVGVAGFPEGHPGTPNRLLEMDNLKAKVDAGADYICTQLFFGNGDFYDFRDRCELAGIRVPILAGIMPVSNMRGLERIAELAGGARIPAKLLRAIAPSAGDDSAVEPIGSRYAAAQCQDLLDHEVDGIHLYTLNKSCAALKIFKSLGLVNTQCKDRNTGIVGKDQVQPVKR